MQPFSANYTSAKPRRVSDDAVMAQLLEYRKTRKSALRDAIVTQYAGLVESTARKFSNASEPVEDLAQEGYIGLLTAIDLYDPAKKVKFSTYATHFIIGQIKHALRDRGKIIKEPAWLQELNGRMTRAINDLAQTLQRPPTHSEIGELMDMSEQAVADLMLTREVFKVASIDGGSSDDDDDGGTLDLERTGGKDNSVTFAFSVEEKVVMETALHKLKELEKKVVTAFYFQDLNQTEIAKSLGVSCNYVSYILRNSTKKLKKILATDEIRDAQLARTQQRRWQDTSGEERLPIVDPLTRLYNRRYFETRLEEELSRSSRMGVELSVVFVKVAQWQTWERSAGLLKAEDAMRGLTAVLTTTLRRTDITTRYAEDTFAIILPHTGQNVEIVCERLRTALADWQEEKADEKGAGNVSVLQFGLGSAVYPRDAAAPVPLTEMAQEGLEPKKTSQLPTFAAVALPRAA